MRARPRRAAGFSYVEVLIAMLLITLALVPAMEALHSGVQGPEIVERRARAHYAVVGKLEAVLAQPYSALETAAAAAGNATTPTSYSDAGGTPERRLVYLAYFDGDGDSVPDPDLMWVQVVMEDTPWSLETVTGR